MKSIKNIFSMKFLVLCLASVSSIALFNLTIHEISAVRKSVATINLSGDFNNFVSTTSLDFSNKKKVLLSMTCLDATNPLLIETLNSLNFNSKNGIITIVGTGSTKQESRQSVELTASCLANIISDYNQKIKKIQLEELKSKEFLASKYKRVIESIEQPNQKKKLSDEIYIETLKQLQKVEDDINYLKFKSIIEANVKTTVIYTEKKPKPYLYITLSILPLFWLIAWILFSRYSIQLRANIGKINSAQQL